MAASSHTTLFNYAEACYNGDVVTVEVKSGKRTEYKHLLHGQPYHWKELDVKRFLFLCNCDVKIMDEFLECAIARKKDDVDQFWARQECLELSCSISRHALPNIQYALMDREACNLPIVRFGSSFLSWKFINSDLAKEVRKECEDGDCCGLVSAYCYSLGERDDTVWDLASRDKNLHDIYVGNLLNGAIPAWENGSMDLYDGYAMTATPIVWNCYCGSKSNEVLGGHASALERALTFVSEIDVDCSLSTRPTFLYIDTRRFKVSDLQLSPEILENLVRVMCSEYHFTKESTKKSIFLSRKRRPAFVLILPPGLNERFFTALVDSYFKLHDIILTKERRRKSDPSSVDLEGKLVVTGKSTTLPRHLSSLKVSAIKRLCLACNELTDIHVPNLVRDIRPCLALEVLDLTGTLITKDGLNNLLSLIKSEQQDFWVLGVGMPCVLDSWSNIACMLKKLFEDTLLLRFVWLSRAEHSARGLWYYPLQNLVPADLLHVIDNAHTDYYTSDVSGDW